MQRNTKKAHNRKAQHQGNVDEFLEILLEEPLTVGMSLKGIRTTLNLSTLEFSKKLRISKTSLYNIEKGCSIVDAKKAAEFARRLGHPIATFVKLSLQDQIRRAGLKLKVEVKAA